MDFPRKVSLFEVAPRDGLQNERAIVPTDRKISLINRMTRAGYRDIEVGSFVSPRWIPQLADTEAVLAGIERAPGVRYWVLVPNHKGFERAVVAGVSHIAVFMSSSESHNKKNVNRTIAESQRDLAEVIGEATSRGMTVRAYVSTVFGCPYEGDVPVEKVEEVAASLLEAGAFQVSLGDTIGVANPAQVQRVMAHLTRSLPLDKLALHFHDTRGTGLANCLAGLQAGVTTFDAALGGIGGCPFAPTATGNLSTEDLLNMLTSMGVNTGLQTDEVADIGLLLRDVLGRELPSRYHHYYAGLRQRSRARAELSAAVS